MELFQRGMSFAAPQWLSARARNQARRMYAVGFLGAGMDWNQRALATKLNVTSELFVRIKADGGEQWQWLTRNQRQVEQSAYNQIGYCLNGSRHFDLALKYYSIILFLFLFLCFASCPKSFPSSREHCPRRSSLGMSPNLHCSCQGQEHFDPKTNPAK